jgi:class 3 adenylate cyclase
MAAMAEERRLVTVLFADVVGSTSLGDGMDPEDLRALLSRFYGIASEVTANHGGTLEKFIGDAALAIFGIPQAHDDDVRRAIAAGLELRDRVKADPVLGDRLPIRLGLNTGEVMASRERSDGNFIVTGDAVNVAARLQQAAEPWQLLVTPRSAHAAGQAFSFGEPMELMVKGKVGAVTALPVLGAAKAAVQRIPLVGREADLDQLLLVARRTFAERRPYLVSVIAPAGTGKTRLLEEFLDRLGSVVPGVRVATAQCLPYGQRLTYAPMRSLLLQLLDLGDESAADEIRTQARRWLRDVGDEDADRTAERLIATIGSADAEVVDRGDIFAAWRHTVELAAADNPLVLVIEDLHWSSESLLDLIEYVLQPRTDAPLLMLVLTRPELLDRRPSWGGGRRNHVSLALDPLEPNEVSRLVELILEGPAPELVRLVVERAEGNPFYVGELVRSIRERAAALDDPVALQAAIATLPDTVQATVLARLDLLDGPARRLLQLGSVHGRSFRLAGVQALEPEAKLDLAGAAERLVERDLVRPSGGDRFSYRHILIREVAYSTLPRSERARLHAAAGHWLAATSAGREDELAELIAFHLREAAALTASTGMRDVAIDAAAVEWLRRAGEVAFASMANVEASRHLLAAIELADPTQLPELYGRLGDTYLAGDQSVEAYATALRLGRDAGRPPDFLLRVLGEMLFVMSRWYASVAGQPAEDDFARLRDEARALFEVAKDRRAKAVFLISEGFVAFWLRNSGVRQPSAEEIAHGMASAQAGMQLAEELDDANLISAALDALGSETQRSDPAGARRIAERRVAMSDRLSMQERSDAYYMVAWMSAVLGELPAVLTAAEGWLGQLQPGQGPAFAVGLSGWRAYALWQLGRWDEVAAAFDQMRSLWLEANRIAAAFALQGMYAAMEVGRARGDAALVDRAKEMFDETVGRFDKSHPTRALAALGVPDPARIAADIIPRAMQYLERPVHVETALAICSDRAYRLDVGALQPLVDFAESAGVRLVGAQAHRAIGISTNDSAALEKALGLFVEVGSLPFAARVRTEIGLLSGNSEMLERGLAELDAYGDRDQLRRINERRTRSST